MMMKSNNRIDCASILQPGGKQDTVPVDESKELSSSTESENLFQPLSIYTNSFGPVKVQNRLFETTTDIGLRPAQEDRFVVVPTLFHEDLSFCSVFDGTVGHYASEFLKNFMLEHLIRRPELQQLIQKTLEINSRTPQDAFNYDEVAMYIREALFNAYLDVDKSLIQMCEDNNWHYASSTGVSAIIWKNMLTVAHVGDSRACIAKVGSDGSVIPEWLTFDHKPHLPHELKRIEQSGGSLAWLYGNKPYIRGGDFARRQVNGEHPKQLNYSRAFGGKDLKMYGLIAEPDINHFEIAPDDKVVLIASDGLWDALNPKVACELVLHAKHAGLNATKELVKCAITQMPRCNVADNITVIAIFLNE